MRCPARRAPPPARERSAAAGERALYDAPVSEPHIRKVRSDELEEVWRVHVASSNDLLARRGRPATRPADAPVASDARAGLASDPDGYFCAVEEGQIRGMVSALIRGRPRKPRDRGAVMLVLDVWGSLCYPSHRGVGDRVAGPTNTHQSALTGGDDHGNPPRR